MLSHRRRDKFSKIAGMNTQIVLLGLGSHYRVAPVAIATMRHTL